MPGHKPIDTVVEGTMATPAAYPGMTVEYAVRASAQRLWSNEVAIAYPGRSEARETRSAGAAAQGEAGADTEKEAREKAEAEAKAQAERLAEETAAYETQETEAREKAEGEAREKAAREAREREGKETAEREQTEKVERERREQAERERKEQAERERKENVEREATETQGEREARETAEREAKERAEREARERAEREANERAEREARERAEREAKESLEVEPVSGPVVKALPTGPPAPASGWHVAFADGFGTAIGSGVGQDNLWQMPSGYEPAEQSNDLNVYGASQVRVGANGLELVAHNQPNVGGTGKNYVSGAVYTIGRFSLRSYAGATFAVECVCRWPRNNGAADPAFWHDGSEGGTEQEVDDFEGFGWNSDGSTEWGAAMPTLVHLGEHIVYHTKGVLNVLGFDPTLAFHRYTTVLKPGAPGQTRAEEYIDGIFKWAFEVTTPSTSVQEHLILSYALREYPERVPSEDTTFAARSVAVYEDGAHAGQFVTGGGVAPGTVVK
jgi:hypothetical protein